MAGLIVLLVFFVLMWVLFILPQQRRVKAQQQYVASLRIGDEIVTAGGIHGTIIELDDDEVQLQVAADVAITIARGAVNRSQHEPVAESESEPDLTEGNELERGSELEEPLDTDVVARPETADDSDEFLS